jgi:hypothetical protein
LLLLISQVADYVKGLDLSPPVNFEGFGVEGSECVSLVIDANLDHLFPLTNRPDVDQESGQAAPYQVCLTINLVIV